VHGLVERQVVAAQAASGLSEDQVRQARRLAFERVPDHRVPVSTTTEAVARQLQLLIAWHDRAAGYHGRMADYTHLHLPDVEDMAPKFGLDDIQEARFATKPLGSDQTGLAYLFVKPGQQQSMAHRHGEQEELYVVLEGSGVAHLDDEQQPLEALDAIRVAPSVARWFEAGEQGLRLLAFGAPAVSGGRNDAEMLEASEAS
jgi:mannose-6-phosphate isomerase-like protein (cupin superfamily)